MYAELHTISNFTFLRGASRPEELVTTAAKLGYQAIAITDECSLAGVVKAHVKTKELQSRGYNTQLIIGSEFTLNDNSKLIALVPDKLAYEELSALITLCRRRSNKGDYQLNIRDLELNLQRCLLIWIPVQTSALQSREKSDVQRNLQRTLASYPHLWIGYTRHYQADDEVRYQLAYRIANTINKPMVACGNVHMHCPQRKMLQDALTAIKHNSSVASLGKKLTPNAEYYLRPIKKLQKQYPEALLQETLDIAERCNFSLDELRYQYPQELVPPRQTPINYLRQLVHNGALQRWHGRIPEDMQTQIENELALIEELHYEYFFLTVHDIVSFARQQNILCQGRGSAANSVVCYCLFITEVDPDRIAVLFERFISKERSEPPDIDVDFEHERREEVIQYIYKKYSRERAALAATVITYRSRSAIRDIGKALGMDAQLTEKLSRSLGWWHKPEDLEQRLRGAGMDINHKGNTQYQTNDGNKSIAMLFMQLVQEILGFPRHLSQHVGGFIISDGPLSRLVPVENASMPERTVVQWDKEDIEALGLLKVDVLGLGMLSAIRKMLAMVNNHYNDRLPVNHKMPISMASIPEGDTATYDMLCDGDSIGIFQVESRAQMSMLPRLKPRVFYDLVIQVAIVRPGPIQGDMVHPFLRRRKGVEAVSYESPDVKDTLERTLGVPIFQEQVINLAMVAAGFTGGQADQLRRAMASWGKNGNLLQFREKLIDGMLTRGYSQQFAERLFEQMKGFGSYGFPESHAASFALLVYVSSWLKCHYPAAFYAALINSQPMGFYSPSQLVQDARRHDIKVLPIDVRHSDWDCTLERNKWGQSKNFPKLETSHQLSPEKFYSDPIYFSIRLGMRLIKGLHQDVAQRICQARNQSAFNNLTDLVQRAQLNQHDRTALIRANATASLSGHRHQSHWQNLAVDADKWGQSHGSDPIYLNDNIILSAPTEVQDIRADYSFTGLTLQRHPMLVLRNSSPFKHCKRCVDLQTLNHKRFVTVAGVVTGRQRPGTASGIIFVTLEDETGNINVIVWKNRQQQYREILLKSKLLLVKGIMERQGSVIHIIAGQLQDFSHRLEDYLLPSRDFH